GYLRSQRLASSIEPEQMIDADRSRSARRKVEGDEAEEHRGRAVGLDGPEAAREMADEVRERHLARGDEGCRPSQEAQEDERAEHELNHARGHEERRQLDPVGHAAEPAEELHPARMDEQKSRPDAQERMSEAGQTVHDSSLPQATIAVRQPK